MIPAVPVLYNGWTKETVVKYETLQQLWYSKKIAGEIINACKNEAKNPDHCIATISFIGKAESNAGKNMNKNNLVWFNDRKSYKDTKTNIKRFVIRYKKWWYKTTWPRDFYSPRWEVSKTWYCTSEKSSKSKVGCPNGLKISLEFFNNYILKLWKSMKSLQKKSE
jgi:hypothetical protein